jgi:putative tryptophan/tyrosine transport system substrate-binding protein
MGRNVVCRTALLVGTIVILTALMLPRAATARRPAQVRRIAILGFGSPSSAPAPQPWVEEFQHEMRQRGWIEGANLAILSRWTEGGRDQFATLVAEVLGLQVEVIVVPNAMTAQIAKQATSTIPIIVTGGGLSAVVPSLARSVDNVTGISTSGPQLITKRLELLMQAVPRLTRVAVLRGPASQALELQALEEAARSLAVALQLFEAPAPPAFDSAFTAITDAKVQALFVFGDVAYERYSRRIADFAVQQQLPSICGNRRYVEAGCLMSYSASGHGRGQQIAAYVDKILHGAKPADLPVEQAMRFEFVINLQTAQALGLTLPPEILFLADEVIR